MFGIASPQAQPENDLQKQGQHSSEACAASGARRS
jgi:hypothetical protein